MSVLSRSTDTIVDDVTIPDSEKQPLLREFHRSTVKPRWTFSGSGPHEKDREYDNIVTELSPSCKSMFSILFSCVFTEFLSDTDITHKMSVGMADYSHKASTSSGTPLGLIEEYDL